ncbi:MAG TPA: nucleoside kinase [Anaerolineales bacterium]|nr:nucleoside kinase [Anaerolineales bacterium]
MTEKIKIESLSEEVYVHLKDGKIISAPRGTQIGKILEIVADDYDAKIVGAIVNDELRELTYAINFEARVEPVTMRSPDGMRIYRRSLTMLVEAAFTQLHPKKEIVIDHSVSFGGYYCRVAGEDHLSEEDLSELYDQMRALVDADIPIERKEVKLDDAIAYFQELRHWDKVKLLRHRKKDYLMLYYLGDFRDYQYGYMLPSSGYLQWFALELAEGGFTLRFPRRAKPEEIQPLYNYPKLLTAFRRYGDWLELLEIDSVGALNDAVIDGRIQEVILVSEALHDQHIAEIASQIAARKGEVRVVMIAGPSSSGKTTSSRRLSIQLLAHGIQPFPLELDNYFVDRANTPMGANGDYNFEHVDALNRERLNEDMSKLVRGEKVQLPKYDFYTGTSIPGEVIQLKPDQIIILEGIHGLNPELVSQIPNDQTFRIYISALTQLNLDQHNRVSTTDTRLLRRILRDARTRGYSPAETIARWESVRLGEKRYIFPYQENADVMFNSALVYEMAALKPLVEPLLRQVPFGTAEHIEVKRLLALLEWFQPVEHSFIPDNSLLREFIGGSILKNFRIWKNSH